MNMPKRHEIEMAVDHHDYCDASLNVTENCHCGARERLRRDGIQTYGGIQDNVIHFDMADLIELEEEKLNNFGQGPGGIRTFSSGATRDGDQDKPDYEGFLSPAVLKRYGQYMHQHRKQSDGSMRDSDNWQKGIPQDQYMKSMLRHMVELWEMRREWPQCYARPQCYANQEETLCALLFNVSGLLFEILHNRDVGK